LTVLFSSALSTASFGCVHPPPCGFVLSVFCVYWCVFRCCLSFRPSATGSIDLFTVTFSSLRAVPCLLSFPFIPFHETCSFFLLLFFFSAVLPFSYVSMQLHSLLIFFPYASSFASSALRLLPSFVSSYLRDSFFYFSASSFRCLFRIPYVDPLFISFCFFFFLDSFPFTRHPFVACAFCGPCRFPNSFRFTLSFFALISTPVVSPTRSRLVLISIHY